MDFQWHVARAAFCDWRGPLWARRVVKSSNLGDNRTLAIPVAHTIYFEMGPERRASMGIDESLIRISVGIEDSEELVADLQQAFPPNGS